MIVKVFDKIFISNIYDANNVYKLINLNIGAVLTCFECNGIEWCNHHENDKSNLLFYKDRLIKCKGEVPEEINSTNSFNSNMLSLNNIIDNNDKTINIPKTILNEEFEHCDNIIFPQEILNEKLENNVIKDYINSMIEIENDVGIYCFKNSESNLKELINLKTHEEELNNNSEYNENENENIYTHNIANAQTVCEMNKTMRKNFSISYNNIYKMKHMYLNILDTYDENILNHIEKAHEFIDNTINENKNILIHCMAGISRCSSIILSYVSRKNKKGINHNFSILKSRYPFAHPNDNFYRQLLLYEKMNYNLDVIKK